MKKTILLTLALSLSIAVLQAQIAKQIIRLSSFTPQQLFVSLNKNTSASKITTRSEDSVRLTGICYYNYNSANYVLTDSDAFTYTGTHSGTFSDYVNPSTQMRFTTGYYYAFNVIDSTFKGDTLVQQTFDANGNVDTTIYQVWNSGTSKWVNNFMGILGYDINHNDTLILIYDWDSGTMKWAPQEKKVSVYTNNNLDTLTDQVYSSNKFVNSYREIDINNTNSVLDTFLDQEWNTGTSSWVNFARDFTSGGTISDSTILLQDYDGNTWVNNLEIITIYDTTTHFVQYLLLLNWSGSVWDSAYKTIFYFDNNYYDTANIQQQFDQGEWLNESKNTSQYNSYSQPIFNASFNYNGSEFIPSGKELYYYQNYATGINQLSVNSNQLSVYPNPTNGLINISSTKNIDEIMVTNLLGQTELKFPLGDLGVKQTIDLSKFADGMYFVTVSSGNETSTTKVVVSR